MRPPASGAYQPMRGAATRRGSITPHRRAWLRLDKWLAVVYRYPGRFIDALPEGAEQGAQYESSVDTEHDEVMLMFEGGRSKVMIDLSDFTALELDAFQSFVNEACEQARPAVEQRDRIAQEVFDDYGDDSHTRLYRAVPELLVRAGEVGEYDSGVRQRLASAADLGRRLRVTRLAGRDDRAVAERDADGGEPEDDAAETRDSEGVRAVDRIRPVSL